MQLNDVIETHFHFLFAKERFCITELHGENNPEVFAILRGRDIALRFSVEEGWLSLAITATGAPRWYDIRDVFCMFHETYEPTNSEDIKSLAAMLQQDIDHIERAFEIREKLKTMKRLEHCISRKSIVRATVASIDTRSKLFSGDELQQFVGREFDFLLREGRYRIVHVDEELPYLEVEGSLLKLSFTNDRGDEAICGSGLHSNEWFGLWMIRSLYEMNFDELSLRTFIQWKPVLRQEIDKIESLFSKQNVSNTVKALKKAQDEYERRIFGKYQRNRP